MKHKNTNALKIICVSFALFSTIMQTTPQQMERVTEYFGCKDSNRIWIRVNSYILIEGYKTHLDETENVISIREHDTLEKEINSNELPSK